MKNLVHTILTLMLSMMFLVMGSGITFKHCHCSGETSIILSHAPGDDDQHSTKDSGCMTIQSVSLSPTTQAQSTAFDFHAFQPLVAIVNDWTTVSSVPQPVVTETDILIAEGHSPPPRQYLQLLRTLRI